MKKLLKTYGPGLLIAATGVGAGDLATSALAGSNIGMVAIMAVVLGGVIKYLLNVGIAQWQIETDATLVEGASSHYGRLAQYAFLFYLTIWSFTVAVALMSASGIALHALWPVFDEPYHAKLVFGAALSLLGIIMVRWGGYRQFEVVMSVAVVFMLFTVFYTVLVLKVESPVDNIQLIPQADQWAWFVAVLGGVGGTVTVLCYGYWIREHNRAGAEGLKISRIDLGVSYLITVLLGVCMVIIGTRIQVAGGGAGLLTSLGSVLDNEAGTVAGLIFKIGAFAAIFTSLLGVWQSVPYLFVNLLHLVNRRPQPSNINTSGTLYRRILYALAVIPMIGLPIGFARTQQIYAICGALFIPLLAGTLLVLATDKQNRYKPRLWIKVAYFIVLLFSLLLLIKVVWD